jgi:SAM-dependent methyltransferase
MTSDIYRTGEYLEKNPGYHVEDSPWKADHIHRMLSKNNVIPRSVYEIGCGAGDVIRQLQQRLQLPETVFSGYDLSPQAIDLAKSRENDRLHYHCADLLLANLEIADLALCIDVVEHVENPLAFVRDLRSKARYKVFHIPLEMTVQGVLRSRAIMASRTGLGHIHYFTKETALAMLTDSGYEIVDHSFTANYLDLPKRSLKARILALPRHLAWFFSKSLAARTFIGFSLIVLAK